ncbi:uncharacterized protein LOC131685034 [Topomyia yanbarensis]|uniref:uncharacterized protein LOC131685034 n=1 Tax=Topomyia yanbarensis TaxID=2498891 RepID=UPI00273C5205|nr:uncharacterized protein LOC131685034 [Topomyia yanbarensis]XP_058824373.1 uncharacterized protein LOC131685034 [Topomyia yanbarensis]
MLRTILKLAYQRQKSLARCYVRRARNPGVERRMALLNSDHLQTSVDELEQMDEADFSQVHKSHKRYEQETQQYRERLQSWIVGNKYFKTKQLNFLTWSEKEQIRYLHNFDPEEWTVDKLVESFPADRYTIVKIIKAKWIPRDENRIQRHDETVRENWEMLKSGRIKNIDDGFAAHLNKFVHRNFQEVQKPKIESKRLYDIQPLPTGGEFSQIITSCKKYSNTSERTELKEIGGIEQVSEPAPSISSKAPHQDMFLMGEVSDRRPRTLSQMKKEFGQPDVTSEIEDPIASSEITEENNNIWNVKKYESELTSYDASASNNDKPDIREFIKIPKKLYKQGATYQLDDCFYDDDGEFLYRVPGMTGKVNR